MRVNTKGVPVVMGCGFIDNNNDVLVKFEGKTIVDTRYSGLMVMHITGAFSASDKQENVRMKFGKRNPIALMHNGRFADGSDMPHAGFYLAYFNADALSVTLF